VFVTAMGKRRNPLMFAITNSGYDRNSVCWNQREYSVKVLQGVIEDDTWFAWICGLDVDEETNEVEDWEDERSWIKANPAMGSIVRIEELREQAKKAKNDPSFLNAFLRFRMSVWTSSHSVWMPLEKWDACKTFIDPDRLRGRRCIGGLDLSTTTDIAAFILLFDPVHDDPFWYVLPFFFLPRANIEKRVKKDRVPYDMWERQGLFSLTEGNVIDYEAIRKKIIDLGEIYQIQEIAFDGWNSSETATKLTDKGFTMVKFGQGFASMSEPTKRLLELVLTDVLAHGNNPVLRWMASNAIVAMDPAGNVKPDKSRSREKIDGIVALVMALGRLMVQPAQHYTSSEIGWI
jgi:phage terminase large subunit-like protein